MNCILCGRPLSEEPVNLEHYVPAVAIRNFRKLGIPGYFNWAKRVGGDEHTVRPVKKHKEWATVKVHQRCNSDASPMCVDLRYIIDHLDEEIPESKLLKIRKYYNHIWKMDDVDVKVLSQEELDDYLKNKDQMLLYTPGIMHIGRVLIYSYKNMNNPGVEQHDIFIGREKAIR